MEAVEFAAQLEKLIADAQQRGLPDEEIETELSTALDLLRGG